MKGTEDTLIRIVYEILNIYVVEIKGSRVKLHVLHFQRTRSCSLSIPQITSTFKDVSEPYEADISILKRKYKCKPPLSQKQENGNDRIIFIINKTREYTYTRKEEAGAHS